jgi:hypothetical protein
MKKGPRRGRPSLLLTAHSSRRLGCQRLRPFFGFSAGLCPTPLTSGTVRLERCCTRRYWLSRYQWPCLLCTSDPGTGVAEAYYVGLAVSRHISDKTDVQIGMPSLVESELL